MHTYEPKLCDTENIWNLSKILFSLSCRFSANRDFALVEFEFKMRYLIEDILCQKLKKLTTTSFIMTIINDRKLKLRRRQSYSLRNL